MYQLVMFYFSMRGRDDAGRRVAVDISDWDFTDPGSIKPEYAGRRTTIPFSSTVAGTLSNWGYGPSFTLDAVNGEDITENPSFTIDATHTPSEHEISGKAAKAEIHLVHQDAAAQNISVVSIPINAGAGSIFFGPGILAALFGQSSSATIAVKTPDIAQLLIEDGNLKKYWTYKGSLMTPPCSEGSRWWVSGKTMTVSQVQIDALLGVINHSARRTQKISAQATSF